MPKDNRVAKNNVIIEARVNLFFLRNVFFMSNRLSSIFIKVPVFLGIIFVLTNCVQKDRNVSSYSEAASDSVEAYNRKTSFETCYDNDRNYLHFDIIDLVPRSYLVRHEKDWSKKIPIRCIQFAQQKYPGRFARCDSSESDYTITKVKPCLSETYTNFVYNAYHDVSDCFNIDPKKSYLQIFIESGFHINAINHTGFDAGIGQFTANGIQRVGHDLINRVERVLSASTSPSCARIANLMGRLKPDDFNKKMRCSVVALPENPYRSLVMHYLHGLLDKLHFESEFFSKRPDLKEIITEEIISQFIMLAYNRGIAGTEKLIDGYVKYMKAGKQTLTANHFNLWQNVNAAIKIMKRDERYRKYLKSVIAHGSGHKKHTTMSFAEYLAVQDKTYMAQMTAARDWVQGQFGPQTCFDAF